ncbi:MAG: cation:proton antiporter [Bacteroidia bacterium]|nr:cation:proton antiporter [Bacteroidia bacterium]
MGSLELILGASVVLIASYFFNVVAKRTNVPAVLMLMVLGFLIQQFAGFSQDAILPYLEVLGTVGVILIVLEAALDLKLEKEKTRMIITSGLLAALLLLLTTAIIAVGIYLFYGTGFVEFFSHDDHIADPNQKAWYVAFLYAIPLAVMSSAIIIPSVGGLIDLKKELLIFESAFSDILGIIFFYGMLSADHAEEGSNLMLGTFGGIFLTIVLSVVVSYALIVLFQYLSDGAKLSLLIAILLGFYALGKIYHLSPLILILVFGLMLNNQKLFFAGPFKRLVKEERFKEILHNLHLITLEAAFAVRTFFFVIFGMSIVLAQLLHWTVPLITLIALFAIYGSRFVGLRVALGKDIYPEVFVAPRGLITVLLFYAIPAHLIPSRDLGDGVSEPIFESGILLLTILLTSLIMTYGLIRDARINAKNAKAEAESKEGGESNSNGEGGGEKVAESTSSEGGGSESRPPVSSFPPPGQEID